MGNPSINDYERWGFLRFLLNYLDLGKCADDNCKESQKKWWKKLEHFTSALKQKIKQPCSANLPTLNPVVNRSKVILKAEMQKLKYVSDVVSYKNILKSIYRFQSKISVKLFQFATTPFDATLKYYITLVSKTNFTYVSKLLTDFAKTKDDFMTKKDFLEKERLILYDELDKAGFK